MSFKAGRAEFNETSAHSRTGWLKFTTLSAHTSWMAEYALAISGRLTGQTQADGIKHTLESDVFLHFALGHSDISRCRETLNGGQQTPTAKQHNHDKIRFTGLNQIGPLGHRALPRSQEIWRLTRNPPVALNLKNITHRCPVRLRREHRACRQNDSDANKN